MADRARQASLAPSDSEEDRPPLAFREDPDPKAVVELLATYHRFFDKLRSRLTRELDAVLLIVERLEAPLTTLRGEVQGLRSERQEFLTRIRRTEKGFRALADEFTRQISDQVALLTNQFASYLNDAFPRMADAGRTAAGLLA